jgi:hypothetical protein
MKMLFYHIHFSINLNISYFINVLLINLKILL